MKKSTNKRKYLAILFIASCISMPAFSQDDGTTGNRALRGRPIVPLRNQELQIIPPANVTNVTNVTQVVQPNTYQVNGTASGQTVASAQADCGGGRLLGGGGSCSDGQGLVAVAASNPSGNSWIIGCQSLNYKAVFATANAICSAN